MALRNALKLVRGLRKQISELDEDIMTAKLINEINLSNYEIVKKAGTCGHVVDLPTETKNTGNRDSSKTASCWSDIASILYTGHVRKSDPKQRAFAAGHRGRNERSR